MKKVEQSSINQTEDQYGLLGIHYLHNQHSLIDKNIESKNIKKPRKKIS